MTAHTRENESECLIAVHLWDWPVPSTVRDQEELLEAFVREGMCNAVCIWPDHQPGAFEVPERLIERYGLSVIFYFYTENVYNWMQSCARAEAARARGEPVPTDSLGQLRWYVDHWADTIRRLSERWPGKVWWSMGHEQYDQSLGHTSASRPEEGIVAARAFGGKREAYQFYREWVTTDLHKIHWSAGHVRQAQTDRIYRHGVDRDIPAVKYALGHDIGVPSTWPYLAERGIDAGSLRFGAGGTVAASAAYLFSLGPEWSFFWWECSYVGTGLQPGIALLRGAARQYGRSWLLDHSPYASRPNSRFSGPAARGLERLGHNTTLASSGASPSPDATGGLSTRRNEVADPTSWRFWWPQYDEDDRRLAGLSEGMILRDWLWGYMSGADCVFQEAAAATHFIKPAGSTELRLTPYGRAAKKLNAFARDAGRRRGRPRSPVALLMDFHHGLDPSRRPASVPWRNGRDLTWGSIPFTPGDHMANGFFDLAFPGHASWPERELPWRSAEEYAVLLRAGMDERPWERQTVVPSTWGDIFDVLLDNADLAHLARYEAVVVLGDVTLTGAWVEGLLGFARGGGRVLVNADQIPPELWRAEMGVLPIMDGDRVATSADCRFCVDGGAPRQDRAFEAVRMRAAGAATPITSPDGLPLLAEREMGRGRFWVTAARHLTGGGELLAHAREVFERFLRFFAPLAVQGRPLAHIVADRDDGSALLTLCNTSPEQWIGRILFRDSPRCAGGTARDVWNGCAVVHERLAAGLLLTLCLPAWGLAVIEVRPNGLG